MSDVSKWISDAWNDAVALFHGKEPSAPLGADSKKLLDDATAVIAGLGAAGPYAPAVVTDVAALVAEITALAASKGLDLPELGAVASSGQQLASDLSKIETAFLDKMNAIKATALLVAAAPAKPPS